MTAERFSIVLLAVTSMIAAGLAPPQRSSGRTFVVAYVLNVLAMLGVALLVLRAPFASEPFRLGVALSVASAGGNTGATLARWAGADAAFAGRLVVVSALSCAVIVPLSFVALTPAALAPPLLYQALPFVTASLIERKVPRLAERARPWFNRASSVLFLASVVVIASGRAGLLLDQPARTLIAVTLAGAAGFALGACVPGSREQRRATIVVLGTRNLSLPLLLTAALGLSDETLLGVLIYGLPMFVGGIFVALAIKRFAR